MRFYINRKPVLGAWGGGNMFNMAFHKHIEESEHDQLVSDEVTPIDRFLIMGLNAEQNMASLDRAVMYRLLVNPNSKIYLRVNENDARKNTTGVDRSFYDASQHVDGTIFVSNWLRDYYGTRWQCKNATVIRNGVSTNTFKPNETINRALTSRPCHLVAHHWSNNVMKGFDIYDKLDKYVATRSDRYKFTYIGRERGTFKNTTVIKPLWGKSLGTELANHDVYISGSRFDPGPNHILEALSCKLPTYVHKDGGGCVEFAGNDHVYNDWDALKLLLDKGEFTPNDVVLSSWDDCIKQYKDFMENT